MNKRQAKTQGDWTCDRIDFCNVYGRGMFFTMILSMDTLGYIAAFCTTSSFLPQAILTIRTRDTASLSFGMYSLFTIGVFLWLLYGIKKHDSALIWANSITLILASTILSFKVWSMVSSLCEKRREKKSQKR